MEHIWVNVGFLAVVAVVAYFLRRQRQVGSGASRKPKRKQSFEDWAAESRRKVHDARRASSGRDRKP